MNVEYKRFLRLLRALPPQESIFLTVLSAEQITVDEETGQVVRKDEYNKDTKRLKRMLQKQHKRDNRPRQQISLDELMKSGIGGKG